MAHQEIRVTPFNETWLHNQVCGVSPREQDFLFSATILGEPTQVFQKHGQIWLSVEFLAEILDMCILDINRDLDRDLWKKVLTGMNLRSEWWVRFSAIESILLAVVTELAKNSGALQEMITQTQLSPEERAHLQSLKIERDISDEDIITTIRGKYTLLQPIILNQVAASRKTKPLR